MDYDSQYAALALRIDSALSELKALNKAIKSAQVFTAKFLKACSDKGLTAIAIRKRGKQVPASMDFPFGASGSVFSFSPKKEDGWPAIWGICEDFGVSHGCGNSSQHAIKDTPDLIDGIYEFKAGKWNKVS